MTLLKLKDNEEVRRVVEPLVNVREADDRVVLEAEMPGISKDDLNIEIKDNELIISAKARGVEVPSGYSVVHRERFPMEYERRFIVGDTIDRSKIEARYRDGILEVSLVKSASAQPRKIEIKG